MVNDAARHAAARGAEADRPLGAQRRPQDHAGGCQRAAGGEAQAGDGEAAVAVRVPLWGKHERAQSGGAEGAGRVS